MAQLTNRPYDSAMATKPLRVAVLVLKDSTALVPIGVAELIKKTLQFTPPAAGERGIDVVLAGETRRVATAGGYPVDCDVIFDDLGACDLVVVPALDPDILRHLALNEAAVDLIRSLWAAGADCASACTGAFVLAEAGLLDGRRATTHWAFQDLFRARYPAVDLVPQAILVDQGRVCTAGGATSFIQLTHYLVERWLGQDVAHAAARMFLIDVNKSPQGAYATFASQRQHQDARILAAQDLIEANVREPISVAEIARRLAMSDRTLLRRFKDATGNTPLEYLQRVRVETAKRTLEAGTESVKAIAARVGYTDIAAFRAVFARITGLNPAEYRQRYGPRSDPGYVADRLAGGGISVPVGPG